MSENVIKRVAFISSTLNQVGGGEKLLLEGVKYYHKIGLDVHVITWNFDKISMFDGKYTMPNLINLDVETSKKVGDYKFMLIKIFYIFKLRKILVNLKPDLIISQSENDSTVLNLAQLFLKKNYITLIFGQMFQSSHDYTKYSLIFKKHLKPIVNSFVGYGETIPLQNPSRNIFVNLAVEIWSLLRYLSVKKSIKTFVFSKQVQWEVELLYNKKSQILKGAYEEDVLKFLPRYDETFAYRDSPSQSIILMINRLERKKRTHLAIEAMVEVIKLNSNVKLLIGGIGSQFINLQRKIEELNLEKHVTLLGYIKEEKIKDFTINADIFMSLDIADFNISPFSALALKKKIIWSVEMDMDHDLINCDLIKVVNPNPHEVANAILDHIKNKSLFEINNSSIFFKKYTWENYFDTLIHSINGKN